MRCKVLFKIKVWGYREMLLRIGTPVYEEHHYGTSVEWKNIHEMDQILCHLLPINSTVITK